MFVPPSPEAWRATLTWYDPSRFFANSQRFDHGEPQRIEGCFGYSVVEDIGVADDGAGAHVGW